MSAAAAGESAPDPTRSITRRRRFVQEFRRRWRELRGAIRTAVEQEDQFDLSEEGTIVAAALARFRNWLRSRVDDLVVEPAPITDIRGGLHWTASYVREAYEHGLELADQALRQAGYDVPSTAPAASMTRDRHQEQIREEYVRTYHAVLNAGDAIVNDLTQTFDEQQEAGASRRDTADELNERVETVGPNTHTDALAHGAVVVVINRAALERYRQADVEAIGAVVEDELPSREGEVSVQGPVSDDPRAVSGGAPADPDRGARWKTAGDNNVCPQCRALEGRSWPMSAFATGDAPIPVKSTHPRCRCFLVPISLTSAS